MPTWKHTLHLADVFHNGELTLEQKTERIVARIEKAAWYEKANHNGDLTNILDELANAGEMDDRQWWDSVWAAFYDIADAESVWVKTF